jgi:ribosomal protein L29
MKRTITITNRAELEKLLAEKRLALRAFRFGASGGKLKNVKQARDNKKAIARILTKLQALPAQS